MAQSCNLVFRGNFWGHSSSWRSQSLAWYGLPNHKTNYNRKWNEDKVHVLLWDWKYPYKLRNLTRIPWLSKHEKFHRNLQYPKFQGSQGSSSIPALCIHCWFDKIFERSNRITASYNIRCVSLHRSEKLMQRTETTAPRPSAFISVFLQCKWGSGCCPSKISSFGEAGKLLLRSDKMSNHTPEGNRFGLTIQRKSSA